jgi:G3E family GTPase
VATAATEVGALTLLDHAAPDQAPGQAGAAASQALETWSFETDEPLDLASLRDVAAHLPAGIYRAKGIVKASEIADRSVILHVVGRRVDLSTGAPWAGSERRTRIVAIGARGALGDGLASLLRDCLAVPCLVRGAR